MAKFNMSDLLNNQSKGAGKPALECFEIKHIPIENIVPSANNKYGIRNIEEMAASIEMIGLLHNLVVRKIDNSDMYEIVSGERRFRGIKKLYEEGKTEWKTIPCKVERNKDDIFMELELLFANSTARELTDYEKTYQAGRIKELLTDLKKSGYKFTGRMREIVAEMLKVSSAQMGRMESINEKLSPELKEVFKEEGVNITAAYELSRLPQEEQKKALEEYKEKGEIRINEVKERREKVVKPIKPQEDPPEEEKPEPKEAKKQDDPIELIKQIDEAETIRLLKALANDIEAGNDGSRFNIVQICMEAALLLEKQSIIFNKGE